MKRPTYSSRRTLAVSPSDSVVRNAATFSLLDSRYSSCSSICATVECRRSSNHGDSLAAHALHMLPSSSLRLPKRPISPPQIAHSFFSKSFPNSPMVHPPLPNAAFSHCDATEEGPPAFLARLIAAAQFLASAETGFELRGEVRARALPLTALCGGRSAKFHYLIGYFNANAGKYLI